MIKSSKRCLDSQIFSNRIKIGLVGDAALHRAMPKYKTSVPIEDSANFSQFRDDLIKSSNGEIDYEGEAYSFFMDYTNLIFQEIEADLSKYWDEIVLLANALLERKTLNGEEVEELMAKFGHNPIPLEVQMEEWKDIMEKEALGLPVDFKFSKNTESN
jgi:hypothetical protein